MCVVFADMAGYSALTSRDEAGTHAMWMQFVGEVVLPKSTEHNGTIIRTLGDGILLTFESASAAVQWSLEVQKAIKDARIEAINPFTGLALRIAVHICEAICDGDDVYGDGVNITKRLQDSTAPDGIIVSEELYHAVRKSIPLEVRNLGYLNLKNISEPVHAFEILQRATIPAAGAPSIESNLPSIAVLPLQNLSGSDEDTYFSDGVVEDIIISLSALKELFVISRASALAFGAGPTDPREVGRILGVRYVLQGTMRRSNTRIRVSTTLSDTQSGETLYSEKSEFSHSDLFEVQDRIVERVVSRIAPNVRASERTRALRKPPDNFTAYDNCLKALDLMTSLDRERFDEAMDYLEKAMELDVNFVMPVAYAARWHCIYIGQGWAEDRDAMVARARDYASRAVNLDRQNALALAAYGHVKSYLERDYDSAIVFLDRARELAPSHALAWINSAAALSYVGRAEEALTHAEYAIRLSPHDPDIYMYYDVLSGVYYFNDRFSEGILWASQARALNGAYTSNLRQLAVNYAALGQKKEAQRAAEELLRLDPDFRVSTYAEESCPFREPELRDRFLTHLTEAGLPH
ncbi:MAG: adenylate/guanylate cyclase domain-containing protein [Pseudomonadota bacterium]